MLLLILLLCIYTIYRGPHRRWFICCRRDKAKGQAVPQVETVGLWGKSDAPTFTKSGVYLTDLKRQFGTSRTSQVNPPVKEKDMERAGLAQNVVSAALPRSGPQIIDGGMGFPRPLKSQSHQFWTSGRASPRLPIHKIKTSLAGGQNPRASSPSTPSPLSSSPQSPVARATASILAKEWKVRSKAPPVDRSIKVSSGSSFRHPAPAVMEKPMPQQSLAGVQEGNQAYRHQSLRKTADNQRDSRDALDFYKPRMTMLDQRAAPPAPKSTRRPPTNFSLDTTRPESAPSMYSIPAQSMYVPTAQSSVTVSRAQEGAGNVPAARSSSRALQIDIPEQDQAKLQIRKSQSSVSLHSPMRASPLAHGYTLPTDDKGRERSLPCFQTAPEVQERDWTVSVISTHAM